MKRTVITLLLVAICGLAAAAAELEGGTVSSGGKTDMTGNTLK